MSDYRALVFDWCETRVAGDWRQSFCSQIGAKLPRNGILAKIIF
jgi:hypothetical protein